MRSRDDRAFFEVFCFGCDRWLGIVRTSTTIRLHALSQTSAEEVTKRHRCLGRCNKANHLYSTTSFYYSQTIIFTKIQLYLNRAIICQKHTSEASSHMVAGIRGTCRMSIILAFKIGFLGCTLSWSCTGSQCWSCTGLGNRQCWSCTGSLETIFSFMEMRSVIWGGEGRGFGRTDLTTPPRVRPDPGAPLGPGAGPAPLGHEP